MRVLVTGGAGFIGSHICEQLLFEGHFVLAIDNLSTGSINNIRFLMHQDNFMFMISDIRNVDALINALIYHKIDRICHQAALGSVPRSINTPGDTHDSNVTGFFNVLNAARLCNIKRVVYASSSSVYGSNTDLPKVESNIGKQLSPYAVSKYFDEVYADIFTRCYNMECIGLRYFNIFGPRQSPDGPYAAVIPRFVSALREDKNPEIYGNGEYSRDFTYVKNAVSANILALFTTNSKCFGEAFNIGSGGCVSINKLYETIAKGLEKSYIKPIYKENRKGDVPHSMASIQKAKELLDYEVVVTFDDGIQRLLSN